MHVCAERTCKGDFLGSAALLCTSDVLGSNGFKKELCSWLLDNELAGFRLKLTEFEEDPFSSSLKETIKLPDFDLEGGLFARIDEGNETETAPLMTSAILNIQNQECCVGYKTKFSTDTISRGTLILSLYLRSTEYRVLHFPPNSPVRMTGALSIHKTITQNCGLTLLSLASKAPLPLLIEQLRRSESNEKEGM